MDRQLLMKYSIALIVGLFLIVIVFMNLFGDKKKGTGDDDLFGDGGYEEDVGDDFDSELQDLLEDLEEDEPIDSPDKEGTGDAPKEVEAPGKADGSDAPSRKFDGTYNLATDSYGVHEEYEAIYLEKFDEAKMKEFYATANNVATLWFESSKEWGAWKSFVTPNYLAQLEKTLPNVNAKQVSDIAVHLTDPSLIEDRVIIGAVGVSGDKQEMLEVVFEEVNGSYLVSAIGVVWSDL